MPSQSEIEYVNILKAMPSYHAGIERKAVPAIEEYVIATTGERSDMTDLPINEKATQLKTQQKIYNSPHPRLPLKISRGFPLDITTIAPVTEIATPASLNIFSLSLKKYDARRVIKTGLFAMIRAARPAPIILSPLKKKILYVKMPVIPRRITGIICFLLIA